MRESAELQKIIDAQPGLKRSRGFLAENWLAMLMFAGWMATQLLDAGGWLRDNAGLSQQIADLRKDLAAAAMTYVRQDVFSSELRGINQRLDGIERNTRR